jgi:hypothetical protein
MLTGDRREVQQKQQLPRSKVAGGVCQTNSLLAAHQGRGPFGSTPTINYVDKYLSIY